VKRKLTDFRAGEVYESAISKKEIATLSRPSADKRKRFSIFAPRQMLLCVHTACVRLRCGVLRCAAAKKRSNTQRVAARHWDAFDVNESSTLYLGFSPQTWSMRQPLCIKDGTSRLEYTVNRWSSSLFFQHRSGSADSRWTTRAMQIMPDKLPC